MQETRHIPHATCKYYTCAAIGIWKQINAFSHGYDSHVISQLFPLEQKDIPLNAVKDRSIIYECKQNNIQFKYLNKRKDLFNPMLNNNGAMDIVMRSRILLQNIPSFKVQTYNDNTNAQ
eukprot:31602_1